MATTTKRHDFGSAIANMIGGQDTAINDMLREVMIHNANTFARIRDRLAARRARREAYNELADMSDRDLADIGIARTDIPAVLDGTFVPRR